MIPSAYLTAAEAAAELGVSLATLYSYVSRGLIRSETGGSAKRQRRYRREDIEKLKERKEQRRSPAKAIQQALYWGAPVLESGLTLIADGQLYYRGLNAGELAVTRSFEDVVAWLWAADFSFSAVFFRLDSPLPGLPALLGGDLAARLSPVDAFQSVLPLAEDGDLRAYDLRPQAVAQTGGRILQLFTTLIAGGSRPATGETAARLQETWAPHLPQAVHLLNAALILCADHELNISAFTARCVASAGATPYAVVNAGLAALRGAKHGGMVARVEALLHEVGEPGRAEAVVKDRLRRGESLPGFGHALYRQGDPRAVLILDLLRESFSASPALSLVDELSQAALTLIGERPTLDLALATLGRALHLPPGGPLAIFALGRTAGWIAHAIEQYQTDQLIRPRARYTGPQPDE